MLPQALFNHKVDATTTNGTNYQASESSTTGSISSVDGTTSSSNKIISNGKDSEKQSVSKDIVKTEETSVNNDLAKRNNSFNESSIEIKEFEQRWGYSIGDLFDICLKFHKNNESKAFHPTFDQRNKLNALIIQAKHGKYDEKKMPDIGVLDLVGKNRRNQWSLLGDMSKSEAKYRFILIIDEICPLFKAHVEAIRLDNNNGRLDTNANNLHTDIGRLEQQSNDNGSDNTLDKGLDESDRLAQSIMEQQNKAIYEVLCKQTHDQFNKYAYSQYPNDETKREYLVKKLHSQYYNQYMQQVYQQQQQTVHQDESPVVTDNSSDLKQRSQNHNYRTREEEKILNADHVYQPKAENLHYTKVDDTYQAEAYNFYKTKVENVSLPQPSDLNQPKPLDVNQPRAEDVYQPKVEDAHQPKAGNVHQPKVENIEQPKEEINMGPQANFDSNQDRSYSDSLPDSADHSADEEEEQDEEEDWPIDSHNLDINMATPSLWTRNTIDEFKESIRNEGRTGIFVVHFGESVTVRAPTHPNGKSIYWEFATDNFDIGFGVMFQFDKNLSKDRTESINYDIGDADINTDDDDNQDHSHSVREQCDIENGINEDDNNKGNKIPSKDFTSIVVIPIYRRDSHEEVYAGRHDYPGQGVYLLKFDNTYSKLRSKTVYYRVCYYPHYESAVRP